MCGKKLYLKLLTLSRLNITKNGKPNVRHFSHQQTLRRSASAENRPPPGNKLLDKSLSPYMPHTARELAEYLIKDVLYYSPGDVLALNKPYGISCLGYKQQMGGIFNSSIRNESNYELEEHADNSITLESALPFLREHFNEPHLTFCTGLKRTTSGPVVLPCSSKSFKKIRNSILYSTIQQLDMYRALCICLSCPKEREGFVEGHATFQKTTTANEKVNRRAKYAKFAVPGRLEYKVLGTKNGCSLISISFSKFARHIPRLILLQLGSPILGDSLYGRRVIQIEDETAIVEPKNLNRLNTDQQIYAPKEFLKKAGIEKITQLGRNSPIFWTVYQVNFPMFGNTKEEKQLELVVRGPPPDHFITMAKLLDLEPIMRTYLNSLENSEDEEEPHTIGGDEKF